MYKHVHREIEVTQGFQFFSGCSKKGWRCDQQISTPKYIVVGMFLNFLFTNNKRLTMLLLGAILVTMHVFGLGGIICCLHFWYFGMFLKGNRLESKILRIMDNVYASLVIQLLICGVKM